MKAKLATPVSCLLGTFLELLQPKAHLFLYYNHIMHKAVNVVDAVGENQDPYQLPEKFK